MSFKGNLKKEDGLIARGGCAVFLIVILFIGAIFGFIIGIASDDWSLFSFFGGFLILNIIINAIIYGVNKSRENSYSSYYNKDNLRGIEKKELNIKEDNIVIDLREDEKRRIKEWNEIIELEKVEKEKVGGNPINSKDKSIEVKEEKESNIKFCKYCGNKLPANANFCKFCGKKIE